MNKIQHAGIYFSCFFTYDFQKVKDKKFKANFLIEKDESENLDFQNQRFYRQLSNLGIENTTEHKVNYTLVYKDVESFANLKAINKNGDFLCDYVIDKIQVFLFPHEKGMITFKCSLSQDLLTFFTLVALTASLKNISPKNQAKNKNELENIVENFILPCFTNNITDWRINNANFKLYMNIDVQENFESDDEWNLLLFDLATTSPIGTSKGGKLFSPSKQYYLRIIQNNTINIFENWRVLCLYDSIVRISINLCKLDTHNLWENEYFVIYKLSMYIRYYINFVNTNFINLISQNKKSAVKRHHFSSFVSNFDMNQISQKFIHNVIFTSYSNAFQLNNELQNLKQKLSDVDKKIEQNQEERIQFLLKLIAFFTLFSILLDAVNLIRDLTGLSDTPTNTRIIITSVIFVIIFMMILFRKKIFIKK